VRASAIAVSVLTALIVSLAMPSPMAAQQWTPEQQEVWQTVETYTELASQGDLEGFMSYFHEDFLGWVSGQVAPTNKADRWPILEHNMAIREVVQNTLKPAGISIHGDFAIVHYYQMTTSRNAEGEVRTRQSHWTDIFMKQGNRWVLIGDSGGVVSEN